MPFKALPVEVSCSSDVVAIDAAAVRAETPCGEGILVWRSWGCETGPPVVLLHGGSGSWNHWVRNISALTAQGYRVLAPDLPGFGESSQTPTGFDADAHTEWILLGLQRLLGDAPCELVGFSFGSMVAAFAASHQPWRVRRLVLVGAPALTDERGPSLALRPWRNLPLGVARKAAHEHNLRTVMLSRQAVPSDFAVDLHAVNVERDRIPHRRLFRTDAIAKSLPSISCPVWGIWGTHDALHRGRLETYAEVLATAPNFQNLTLIPGAGHWVQFEGAARFNGVLQAILESR